jgi:S1-C subfamily serine protease
MTNHTFYWLWAPGLALVVTVPADASRAQDLRERGRPAESPFQEESDRKRSRDELPSTRREGGIPRGQVTQQGEGEADATEEGMPQMRTAPGKGRISPSIVPPDGRQWRLGVFVFNTESGVVITRIVPGSAATRIGLERGDRIVSIGGYQIGWVDDRLYPLGSELQRHAGGRGDVLLLVQNVRNRRLQNLQVQLDRVR